MTEFAVTSEETTDDQICEHLIGLKTLGHGWDVILDGEVSYRFPFCPKCGEKL